MSHLAHLASRLYPRWWRERYGDEFAALLDDARPGAAGAFDIAKGALWMRLTNPKQVFALCTILGLAVSLIAYLNQPPPPASRVLLKMPAGDSPEQASQRLAAASLPVLSRTGLTTTLRNLALYETDARRLPIAEIVENMRDATTIEPVNGGLVKVEFRGERPKEVAEYLAGQLTTAGYTVHEPADPPPASPPRTLLIVGAPSGLFLGLAAALWMWLRNEEVTS